MWYNHLGSSLLLLVPNALFLPEIPPNFWRTPVLRYWYKFSVFLYFFGLFRKDLGGNGGNGVGSGDHFEMIPLHMQEFHHFEILYFFKPYSLINSIVRSMYLWNSSAKITALKIPGIFGIYSVLPEASLWSKPPVIWLISQTSFPSFQIIQFRIKQMQRHSSTPLHCTHLAKY